MCICGDLVKDIGLAQPTISAFKRVKVGISKELRRYEVFVCIDQENWDKKKNTLSLF
jgi:hypothetical protein